MHLKDKTVLVTGGGRGLGRAYCEALSKAGASVVVADIRKTQDTVETIISIEPISVVLFLVNLVNTLIPKTTNITPTTT